MNTFDAEGSSTAREAALADVEEGATEAWKAAALAAVKFVCEKRAEFTTDAIWFVLEKRIGADGPSEPRAMGAILRRAVTEGWCEPTNRTSKSSRIACHRRPLAVWHSRICTAPVAPTAPDGRQPAANASR